MAHSWPGRLPTSGLIRRNVARRQRLRIQQRLDFLDALTGSQPLPSRLSLVLGVRHGGSPGLEFEYGGYRALQIPDQSKTWRGKATGIRQFRGR